MKKTCRIKNVLYMIALFIFCIFDVLAYKSYSTNSDGTGLLHTDSNVFKLKTRYLLDGSDSDSDSSNSDSSNSDSSNSDSSNSDSSNSDSSNSDSSNSDSSNSESSNSETSNSHSSNSDSSNSDSSQSEGSDSNQISDQEREEYGDAFGSDSSDSRSSHSDGSRSQYIYSDSTGTKHSTGANRKRQPGPLFSDDKYFLMEVYWIVHKMDKGLTLHHSALAAVFQSLQGKQTTIIAHIGNNRKTKKIDYLDQRYPSDFETTLHSINQQRIENFNNMMSKPKQRGVLHAPRSLHLFEVKYHSDKKTGIIFLNTFVNTLKKGRDWKMNNFYQLGHNNCHHFVHDWWLQITGEDKEMPDAKGAKFIQRVTKSGLEERKTGINENTDIGFVELDGEYDTTNWNSQPYVAM